MHIPSSSSFETTFLENLTKQGYVIRPRGKYSLEIWGANLADHYLLTYNPEHKNLCDVVQIPTVTH